MSLLVHAAEYKPESDESPAQKKGNSRVSRVMERISNRKATPRRPPASDTTPNVFDDFPKPETNKEPLTNISPIGDDEDMELGNFTYQQPASKPHLKHMGQSDGLNFSGELDDAYKASPPFEESPSHGRSATFNQSSITDSSETIKKLDYIIHMIEEQRDHKTGHVTEELVLYSFLGIFVIFTIDSFVKVGKYTR